jgi:hypothetical protein
MQKNHPAWRKKSELVKDLKGKDNTPQFFFYKIFLKNSFLKIWQPRLFYVKASAWLPFLLCTRLFPAVK